MMKKGFSTLVWCALLVSANTLAALPSGDVKAGAGLSVQCVACHGPDGNSMNPIWPNLAGQHPKYSYRQLVEFKKGANGKRHNVLMDPIVANLSEQDFRDLAAYFATQTPKLGTADAADLALGQRLYRGGDSSHNIAACQSCHGPRGLGNSAAGFARLSGQHAAYTAKTLNDYRSGARANSPNQIMGMIAKRMSDKQIAAVANYIQGLH